MRLKLAVLALAISSLFPICDAVANSRHHRERHGLLQRFRDRREKQQDESKEPDIAPQCKNGKCQLKKPEHSVLNAPADDN